MTAVHCLWKKNDAHLQPFVAINTVQATAHRRGSATDICYRMTSFSPSTHLSFGVTSRYGVHLPGTYRICTITVNKLTRSPPSTLLLGDSLAWERDAWLGVYVLLAGRFTLRTSATLVSIGKSERSDCTTGGRTDYVRNFPRNSRYRELIAELNFSWVHASSKQIYITIHKFVNMDKLKEWNRLAKNGIHF